MTPKINSRCQEQVRKLKARLKESEEALEAIRKGEVDAVVVQGPVGEQVFTLKSPEKPYRILVESMYEGAATLNNRGDILYANSRLAEILEVSLEELIGGALRIFFKKEQEHVIDGLLKEAVKKNAAAELWMTTAKKKNVFVRLAMRKAIIDNLNGLSLVLSDITDLKVSREKLISAERKLSESRRELLNVIFNSIPVMIILYDPQVKKFTFNDEMRRALGWTEKDTLDGRFMERIYPEKECRRMVEENMKLLEKGWHDLTVTAKDGRKIETSWANIKLSDERIVAIGFDISERKRREKQVREEIRKKEEVATELEQALKVKTDFTSRVSHELRTPLTAIKEGIQLVSKRVVGPINKDQASFLDLSLRNVNRLNNIISDVLDFQGLVSGKVKIEPRINNIRQLLTDIAQTMQLVAKEKGLHLKMNFDESVSEFEFDYERIAQVVNNLLSNSIKFTEKGGIEVETKRQGSFVRVSIKDTGIGIKKGDIPQVFKEFSQFSKDSRKRAGGTGLGLTISREIIQEHNGRIWVESEYSKGTTVHFTLPLKK